MDYFDELEQKQNEEVTTPTPEKLSKNFIKFMFDSKLEALKTELKGWEDFECFDSEQLYKTKKQWISKINYAIRNVERLKAEILKGEEL